MFNPQQPQQGYTPEQLLQFANLQQQAQQQAQQLNQFNNQQNVLMQQQPTNQASANGQNAASLAGLTQQQINLLASQNLQPNGMQNPFLVNQYLNQQQQVQQFQVAQSVHAIGS